MNNIVTHFDYNNHIVFISTYTKIDTPHEKAPGDSAVSNVVATFQQCLSQIASKLSTRDKNQNLGNLKGSWYRELAKKLTDLLVPGALRWWLGVGNDQSIAVCISGRKKAIINIGQKLAEKEPIGLNYAQLIHSRTTASYKKITCGY